MPTKRNGAEKIWQNNFRTHKLVVDIRGEFPAKQLNRFGT